MFPVIIRVKTRVANLPDKPVVEFYDSSKNQWQQNIVVTFNNSGMAIFTLDTDVDIEPYIFFGALQQEKKGCTRILTGIL